MLNKFILSFSLTYVISFIILYLIIMTFKLNFSHVKSNTETPEHDTTSHQ